MNSNINFIVIVAICAVSGVNVSFAEKDWWEVGNFYQIYPRSFKDSNGDGIGDLIGVMEKLDYLKDLGISGAWLSPIFKSPMADFGYDTSNYYLIQDEYGTVEDLEKLVAKAHTLGIKIILDFVPNHTSDENEWFIKSVKRDPFYENFYIWHPGKINNKTGEREPPSNWKSAFRYSAWEWNDERQEYYLHQFVIKQPDLNYREPKVVEQMKDVLKYWLNKGIAGFRIDAVPYLFEVDTDINGNYPDEPVSGLCDDAEGPCYFDHIYTQNLDETYQVVFEWRKLLDDYSKEKGDYTRIMLTEAYTSLQNTVRFYGDENHNGSFVPFNFEMINHLKFNDSGKQFKEVIDSWLSVLPNGRISNWVLGNHDNRRVASRFGVDRIDLLNILLQTLPGIAVTYNGEELGMTDVYIPWNETLDPQACNTNPTIFDSYSRDPARTPFQWDNSSNAGFSTSSKTWLPVAIDYQTNNVQIQIETAKSHLKVFKTLVELRKGNVLQNGNFIEKLYNDDVYVFKREVNNEAFVVLLNFGKKSYDVNLESLFNGLPNKLQVVVSSIQSNYNEGDEVNTSYVDAPSNVGTVFTTIPT